MVLRWRAARAGSATNSNHMRCLSVQYQPSVANRISSCKAYLYFFFFLNNYKFKVAVDRGFGSMSQLTLKAEVIKKPVSQELVRMNSFSILQSLHKI